MEVLGLLIGFVLVVMLVWKLGLFKPIVDLADAAQIASGEFSDKVFSNSVRANQEEAFTTEELQKAINNMAELRAFKRGMLDGSLIPKVKLNASSDS